MRAYSSSTDGLFTRQFDSLTGVNTSSIYPTETLIVPDTQSEFTAVSLEEAKAILPVYDNNSDGYITTLMRGVEDQVGRYIKLDLTKRQRTSYWKNPQRKLKLSFGIHAEITSVIAKDMYGNQTSLVFNTDYVISGMQFKELYILSANIDVDSIQVTYWSGYDAGACPEAIKLACIQELNFQYKNRQDANNPTVAIVNGLTMESRMLLETYIRRI